eukprot:506917-Heterocapsa_arctica.AAC.1
MIYRILNAIVLFFSLLVFKTIVFGLFGLGANVLFVPDAFSTSNKVLCSLSPGLISDNVAFNCADRFPDT